jgi:DNA polymerase-3 subunit gamma/tau
MLFIRSVRRLLARFSPVLWEDDSKIGKVNPLIQGLEENLDKLDPEAKKFEKDIEDIQKTLFKLEAELPDLVPVGQVRRAAYWSRLAPQGKRKFLLIENADRMKDEARNSMLKLLEEPPESLSIVLTSAHPEALLATILSRLRPYRFVRRDAKTQAEVIRRVFKDTRAGTSTKAGGIQSYIESFLPVSEDSLRALAQNFVKALSAKAAGQGQMVKAVMDGAQNFEIRSGFSRFLALCLEAEGAELQAADPGSIARRDKWTRALRNADTGVNSYNLNPAMALERLCYELR